MLIILFLTIAFRNPEISEDLSEIYLRQFWFTYFLRTVHTHTHILAVHSNLFVYLNSIHHAACDNSEYDSNEDADSARNEDCFEIKHALFVLIQDLLRNYSQS